MAEMVLKQLNETNDFDNKGKENVFVYFNALLINSGHTIYLAL